MSSLLAIGGIYLDINGTDFPIEDSGFLPNKEYVGQDYETKIGGSAYNFLETYLELGFQAELIAKLGHDATGRLVNEILHQAGLGNLLVTGHSVSTNISVNLHSPEESVIMTVVGSANQSLKSQEIIDKISDYSNEIKYFYIGGCFKLTSLLPDLRYITQTLKAEGIKIILDHNRIPHNASQEQLNQVLELAKEADYYLPSRDEFIQLWEVESIEAGLRKVAEASRAVIVVKDSSRGAVSINESGEVVTIPAFDVQVNHTVGAGDSFNAGFIAAQEKGYNLAQSMKIANATAALKISQDRPPKWDQVETLANT